MHYVYLIQSIKFPDQTYTGQTQDLKKRLASHNYGSSPHTSKYKPWQIVVYLGFKEKHKAVEFEKYLKSGSGREFTYRRFLN